MSLGSVRDEVRLFIPDAAELSDDEVLSLIQSSVVDLSWDFPRRKQQSFTSTDIANKQKLSLPADWESGFSHVEAVIMVNTDNVDQRDKLHPAKYLVDEVNSFIRFDTKLPSSGRSLDLIYTIKHTIDETQSTLTAPLERALALLAAANIAKILAFRYAKALDVRYAGSETLFRNRAQDMRRLSEDLLAQYRSQISSVPFADVTTPPKLRDVLLQDLAEDLA